MKHHHHAIDKARRKLIDFFRLLTCTLENADQHRKLYGDACFCSDPP